MTAVKNRVAMRALAVVWAVAFLYSCCHRTRASIECSTANNSHAARVARAYERLHHAASRTG